MVLGARLRTVMSSIIRWRKAQKPQWAGGMEYGVERVFCRSQRAQCPVTENLVEEQIGEPSLTLIGANLRPAGRGNRIPA